MVPDGMGHVNIVGAKGRIPADLAGLSAGEKDGHKRSRDLSATRSQRAASDGGPLRAAATYPRPAYASTGRRDAAALGLKLVLIVGITSSFLGIA